jgi:hypothetical protein
LAAAGGGIHDGLLEVLGRDVLGKFLTFGDARAAEFRDGSLGLQPRVRAIGYGVHGLPARPLAPSLRDFQLRWMARPRFLLAVERGVERAIGSQGKAVIRVRRGAGNWTAACPSYWAVIFLTTPWIACVPK